VQSCVYQRSGHSTSVAMGVFLAALESAADAIRARFEQKQLLRLDAIAV
jgi:hypothetical protein